MTVTPSGAPYRPAYIRAANGLYYRLGVSTTLDAPTDHGSLTNLDLDQHTHYITAARVVAGTNISITRTTRPGAVTINSTSTAGVTDHGLLNGLDDDDHAQYHNDTRGDVRYLKRNVNDETTGALLAPIYILVGTPGASSLIRFDIGNDGTDHRWTIGRTSEAETGFGTGSDFAIYRYNDDGVYLSIPLLIDRASGAVRVSAAPAFFTDQVVTEARLTTKLSRAETYIIGQGTFGTFPGTYWQQPYVYRQGNIHTITGMFTSTANKSLVAGTIYPLGKIQDTTFHPAFGSIWPGASYSLNGSAAGSAIGRLSLAPDGILSFQPTTSGTLTANVGWVSVSGNYHKNVIN